MRPLLPLGARAAYGTEVPVVRKVKPVLQPAGVPGSQKIGAGHKKLHFRASNRENRCEEASYAQRTGENRESYSGCIWNRRSRNLARRSWHEPGPNKNDKEGARGKDRRCGGRAG